MLTPLTTEQTSKVLPAETILAFLSDHQFLHPHQSLDEVLRGAVDTAGVCPEAIAQAMQKLQLQAGQVVGRLRRSELVQLARSIHRNWKQEISQKSPIL
jgi:hypothetical protein